MGCNGNCGFRRICPNCSSRFDDGGRLSRADCNMPVRRRLEPVLVARIYNQQIVEEIPHSAMSMTVDNTARISNAFTNRIPECCECRDDCDGGCDGRIADDGMQFPSFM